MQNDHNGISEQRGLRSPGQKASSLWIITPKDSLPEGSMWVTAFLTYSSNFHLWKCYGLTPGSHGCQECALLLRPRVLLGTQEKLSGVFGTMVWLVQIVLRVGHWEVEMVAIALQG